MTPTVIDEATAKIDQRIDELRTELDQLEQAKSALSGVNGSAPSRRTGSRRGRRTSSPRAQTRRSTSSKRKPAAKRSRTPAAKVDRAAELKGLIKRDPQIRPSDAAKQMGVSSQQVHGVIKRLTDRGELTRDGKRLKVAA